MSKQRVSHAALEVVPAIEQDLTRRRCLAGLGVQRSLSRLRLAARPNTATVVTSDGISRTTLESYDNNGAGEEFTPVLAVTRPASGSQCTITPAVGYNYVLEGVEESHTKAKLCSAAQLVRAVRINAVTSSDLSQR